MRRCRGREYRLLLIIKLVRAMRELDVDYKRDGRRVTFTFETGDGKVGALYGWERRTGGNSKGVGEVAKTFC